MENENRFMAMDAYLKGDCRTEQRSRSNGSIAFSQSTDWASSMSAQDRVLVVLIENGGVDLGIPALVDRLFTALHVGSVVPDSVKQQLISTIREKIRSFTDNLIETAELTLNRYNAAAPGLFGSVVVLRDGTASYNELKSTLTRLTRENKIIDLMILTHGSTDYISVAGAIDGDKIRAIKAEAGRPLSIRSVYMMNCVGSSLNQAWIDAGAKVSSGSLRNNYLPEPTTYFFWTNWKNGQGFETAATGAYRQTVNMMNTAVRTAIGAIPFMSGYAASFNFETYDFVAGSAPVVQGLRTVTISTDNLTFAQSQSSSMATTVLPLSLLKSLSVPGGGPNKVVSPRGIEIIRNYGGQTDTPEFQQAISDVQRYLNDSSNIQAELNQNQFDALGSFAHSIGIDRFASSTLRTILNQMNYPGVPAEIRKWTKGVGDNGQKVDVPELVARRNREASLFDSNMVTAQSLVSAMSAVNYTVPGQPAIIRQPSDMTCWAAVMTMMMSWRRQQSLQIGTAMSLLGPTYVTMFNNGQGLSAATAAQLYRDAGLVTITSFNPTIEGWENLLRTHGLLYVDIGYGNRSTTHAIIVTAISGDGTASGTNITYINPGPGASTTVTFEAFLRNYEAPGAVRWPHVIVHWPAAISTAKSLNGFSQPFYDTGEHAMLGEFLNNAVSGPISGVPPLQPGVTFPINGVDFTYGQIVTMGDFYNTYNDLAHASAAELGRLKVLIQRDEAHFKAKILQTGSIPAGVSNETWGGPDGIGHRFIDLALLNNSHFSPPPAGTPTSTANNKQSWETCHAAAIRSVRAGNNSNALQAAYPMNAFGDHFLTDAFSAGHLMNKEIVMNRFLANVLSGGTVTSAGDRMLERIAAGALAIPAVNTLLGRFEVNSGHWYMPNWDLNDTGVLYPEVFYRVLKAVLEDTAHQGNLKIANLAAKAVHDHLNNYPGGVPVRNNRGDSWNLTGDGTLNIANVQKIQLAVKQSVENLSDAVTNPSTPVATYYQRVWDYVPNLAHPATATILTDAINTFTNPASDQLVRKAITLVEEELPTLLNELLAAGRIQCIRNNRARTLRECQGG